MRRAAWVIVLALSIAAPASARVSNQYSYTYDQVWRAAVRLIAVDFRFPIGDRDPEIGYLLFEYRENGRSYAGSLELVRPEDTTDVHPPIRVVVQVGAMPTYVERMIVDRLSRKLVEEYGTAPQRRPAPVAPTPPADDDDDDEPATDSVAPVAH